MQDEKESQDGEEDSWLVSLLTTTSESTVVENNSSLLTLPILCKKKSPGYLNECQEQSYIL